MYYVVAGNIVGVCLNLHNVFHKLNLILFHSVTMSEILVQIDWTESMNHGLAETSLFYYLSSRFSIKENTFMLVKKKGILQNITAIVGY